MEIQQAKTAALKAKQAAAPYHPSYHPLTTPLPPLTIRHHRLTNPQYPRTIPSPPPYPKQAAAGPSGEEIRKAKQAEFDASLKAAKERGLAQKAERAAAAKTTLDAGAARQPSPIMTGSLLGPRAGTPASAAAPAKAAAATPAAAAAPAAEAAAAK